MTVWSGAEEPEAEFCDQLILGSLREFGQVDGRVEVAGAEACTATYRGGEVKLSVTVRRFADEAAAAAALDGVPTVGTTSEPIPGWDEGRRERGNDPAGWTALDVARRGTVVAEIRLVLPPEVVVGDIEHAGEVVASLTGRVADVLSG